MARYRSNLIFYSYRDIRDAFVSWQIKFGKTGAKPSVRRAKEWINEYLKVKHSSKSLMFKYEDFTHNLPKAIHDISERLEIETDHSLVLKNLPKASVDSSNIRDETTLLYGGHSSGTIQGQWREVLPEKLQKQLMEEFGWWFEENGYDLE